MASGVCTVTEHPGCPHPRCHGHGRLRPLASPLGPIRFPSHHLLRWRREKRMAVSSLPRERAASWLGFLASCGVQLAGPPSWKGYSWLFYKYIYIYFL